MILGPSFQHDKDTRQTPKDRPAEKKAKSLKLPVNELHPVKKFVMVDDKAVETRKVNELAELLWLQDFMDEEARGARLVRAVELFESLEPADGAETMLAAQMVGTHTAALDCLRRAAVDGQTFAGRDMALKHAQKLMALYTKQLETLNKHRGKGQQKVTVEHVNVAAGGQAIVGNVDEPPPLNWSVPIVRKTENRRWELRDRSLKRLLLS